MTIHRVVDWNLERKLHLNPLQWNTEFSFIAEELSEGLRATNDYDRLDALADTVVFAIGTMYKAGYDPHKVMDECLKHIESREGYYNEDQGKFIKTTKPEDMYHPDYLACRRK